MNGKKKILKMVSAFFCSVIIMSQVSISVFAQNYNTEKASASQNLNWSYSYNAELIESNVLKSADDKKLLEREDRGYSLSKLSEKSDSSDKENSSAFVAGETNRKSNSESNNEIQSMWIILAIISVAAVLLAILSKVLFKKPNTQSEKK